MRTLVLIGCCLLLVGCAKPPPVTQGLDEYLAQLKFSPLEPPQTGVASGTILKETRNGEITVAATIVQRNSDGTKTVVAPAECVTSPKPIGAIFRKVAVPAYKYSSKDSFHADAALNNISAKYGVSIDPLIEFSEVESVTVAFKDPYEWDLSSVSAEAAVQPWNELCKKELLNKENVMASRILAAEGISYTFNAKKGHDLKFDAHFLSSMSLTAEQKSELETNGVLSLSGDYSFGYRAFVALPSPGFLTTGVVHLQELSPAQVKGLRIQTHN